MYYHLLINNGHECIPAVRVKISAAGHLLSVYIIISLRKQRAVNHHSGFIPSLSLVTQHLTVCGVCFLAPSQRTAPITQPASHERWSQQPHADEITPITSITTRRLRWSAGSANARPGEGHSTFQEPFTLWNHTCYNYNWIRRNLSIKEHHFWETNPNQPWLRVFLIPLCLVLLGWWWR